MKKETRTVVFDDELRIEAYRFEGIVQPFPNHFHEYYVIGFVEDGQRMLSCRNQEYLIKKGDTVLFNPGDNHACVQNDGSTLDYRGFNISKEVMLDLSEEVTGKRELPGFSENVIQDEEVTCYLQPLHELVMEGACEFGKEENLLLLISMLIQQYGQPFENCVPECREEIEQACTFIKQHYTEHIDLDLICRHAGLSRSTLLRAFTKDKGVTPYSYLENVRISEAKKLLEQGMAPVETALQTGFTDQSHFTNYFNRFIGLTPGIYRDIFLERPLSQNTEDQIDEN
ncbi:helix-turn-helix domain-containing protein [Hespellia stercorisuis]|uniref:AraC-type DNA-binding protein n=1 Tax=Hespellia stercorisuis DSM 15480 TaxID=1121950 RepID=A0A1M6WU12_9FIRM|nr:AraC family transcriptional regulator [Hespellia stercorisuis]SHK97146.1 AraC-type DNA-binding protein [Hespellia stercorisuis DSM 15480]